MPLTFSDFTPVGLAFEVRYPEAYLLWDNAGQVAQDLKARYPVSRLASAEPAKVAFSCGSQELTWQLDRLVVLEHQPEASHFEDFYQLCEDCLDITVHNLGISELNRVGFRPSFAKNFATKEEAGVSLLSTGIVYAPEGKQFNVDALHTYPEYAVRRESEKFGYVLRILVQEVKYEFDPRPQWRGNVVEPRKEQRVTFDLDWYTRAPMPIGALEVKDWLAQIVHAIRRDADRYLAR